jgi:hypothetical protein
MVDWNAEQTAQGYTEARRKIESLQSAAPAAEEAIVY